MNCVSLVSFMENSIFEKFSYFVSRKSFWNLFEKKLVKDQFFERTLSFLIIKKVSNDSSTRVYLQ